MASYLLYIPHKVGTNPDHFREVGLGDVIGDQCPDCLQVAPGPDGGRGILAGWRKRLNQDDVQLSYRPDHQTWIPAPPDGPLEKGRYWLGIELERKVHPDDVARMEQHGGLPVTLADGNEWIIPTARFSNRQSGIDRETGKYVRRIPDEMSAYFELSASVAQSLLASIDESAAAELLAGDSAEPESSIATISVEDGWRLAVKALGMNYHLNPFMISELELIDDRAMGNIGIACVEAIEIVRTNTQKKTESVAVTVPAG